VQLAYLVSKVSLVTTVVLVMLGHLVNLAPLELKDRKVTKEVKVRLALLAKLVHKDLRVIGVYLVCLDLLVPLALVDFVDQLVKLDLQVVLVTKVLLVLLVLLDLWAQLDLLVSQALKDLQVKKDHPVSQADQVTKDHLAMLVHLDLPVLQACLVLLVKLDPLGLLVNEAPLERQDLWVLKDLKDRVVNRVLLDHKVNAENEVKQDLKALKVTEVSLVFRVFPVLLVLKETRDRWALLVLPERVANLGPKDHLVAMEHPDHRALWDHQVRVVALENQANLDLRDHPVPLDLQVLLVNLWDTMLRRWLLFWGKEDRPRALIQWLATILLVFLLNLLTMTAKPSSSRLMSN